MSVLELAWYKIGFSSPPPLAECDIEYISPSEYQSSSKNEDDGSAASKKGSPTSNGYVDPYESLVRGNLERLEKEKVGEWTCIVLE